ncbi:MAG TPA: anthranilate synthase component I [Solirubrobacteraceae bacterium]
MSASAATSQRDAPGLRIEPTLEALQTAAGQHARYPTPSPNLIPLAHTFVEDCETPVSAFLKLRELARGEPCFLLESAEQGTRVGRWSFIGVRPREVLRWSLGDDGDPYALAAAAVGRFRQQPAQTGNGAGALAEVPFTGGAVGYFGYDLVRTVEPLAPPNPDPLGLPDMALMLTDALVVFDHLKHSVTVLANADLEAEPDLERAYASAAGRIAEIRAALGGPIPQKRSGPGAPREMPEFRSNMPRERFEAMVQRIVKYIYAGDAFQVVPSQRWSAEVPVEAFSIYRGLRAVNPSPYMYFLDFGDFEVAGASPEPLLTVSGRHVSTRPIAGTRQRGADAAEDERIATELLEDPKERAEHVMLVDLGRNDLGRVAVPGTVEVVDLMAVERFSHVMHLVSTVVCDVAPTVTALDVLCACFPAGTLSGAPKVRAMEIIEALEPTRRGLYGGIVGYVDVAGDLDTAVAIRTVVMRDGHAFVQAGAGIVADSDPAAEDAESRNKAAAVLAALASAETIHQI